MDFTRALVYPFDDPDWVKKLGLGALISVGGIILSFLIIPPLVVLVLFNGWRYEIIKRVRNDDPVPLPGWDDFGKLFNQGLVLTGAAIVYQIPTLIFACLSVFVFVLPLFGAGNEDVMAALGGVATIAVICCSCIIILYAIVASVVYWGGLVRYVDREEFNTFMQVGENFAIVRDNLGDFGMALLFIILGGAIASVASSVTAGLAGLVAQVFTAYFAGHIIGQLIKQLPASVGGEPAPQV